MPQNTTAGPRPSRRSRRRAGLCPAVSVDVGLRLGDNDHLSRLPLDIVTLILNGLHPVDLLSVSRTCKALRKFLMDPKASRSSVWKPVLKSVEGLPPCPSDLNEPKYIAWVFKPRDGGCHECGARGVTSYFALRLRLCKPCKREQFGESWGLPYDPQIIAITPYYLHVSFHKWGGGFESAKHYHIKTVAALAEEYKRVQGTRAKQAWLEEKKQFWRDREQYVIARKTALTLESKTEEQRQEEENIRQRVKSMKEKLTELGWGREAEKYFQKNSPPRFTSYVTSRFTDDEWIKLEPKLIRLMEKEREVFRLEESDELVKQRIHKWLKPAHTAFILSQPPNELNPSILDVALSDEWRTLLCTEPFDEDLKESQVDAASAKIPEIAETWRKNRIEQLLDVVRKSNAYSGKEVTEDLLRLASTIFRCTNCRPYRGHGDVHTYPHTLVHACNYLNSEASGEDFVEVVLQQLYPWPNNYPRSSGHIVAALEGAGIWSGLGHIAFDDAAHEHMLSLLDVLGWSRDTSAAEMEEMQPYVERLCDRYRGDPAKKPSRKIFRWKKAIYLCEYHLGGQRTCPWFSKLNEEDLIKVKKTEDARETSTQFHCPWCHGRVSDNYLHPRPSLAVHTASCFAIQQPHPPGLKEHAEKVRISTSEVQWLHDEKSVRLVEGDGVEDSSSSDSSLEDCSEDPDTGTHEDSDSEVGSDSSSSDSSSEDSSDTGTHEDSNSEVGSDSSDYDY